MHNPVLIDEVIKGLDIKKDGMYIDATVGEGGHLVKIAETGAKVLGLDWDDQQIQSSKFKIQNFENVTLEVSNFSQIGKVAKELNFYPVDGVLFDLGLSMKQISEGGKGLSFKKLDEPLDMRINSRIRAMASDIVNELNVSQLYEIFASYGEELCSQAIAESVVQARIRRKIETVGDLIGAIDYALKRNNIENQFQKDKIYSRIFQALRIAVNDEFENLKKGLKGALGIVKSGGRIAVITFHSREDRIVKQFTRDSKLKMLTKKVISGNRELKFERSAKLRIIIKS